MFTMTEHLANHVKRNFLKQNCRVCIYFISCIDNTRKVSSNGYYDKFNYTFIFPRVYG